MSYVQPQEATYRARLFAHGGKMHEKTHRIEPLAGEWHPRFLDHPWVRQSITEGWDVELRATVVQAITQRLMANADYRDIKTLMPDAKWVEETRKRAEIYQKAKAWRDGVCAEYGTMDEHYKRTKYIPRVSEFQPTANIPVPNSTGDRLKDILNSLKKIEPSEEEQLTDLSRRMSGDTQ